MVRHFVELLNLLDVRANNRLLLFEHSNCPVHLDIHQLLVVKVLERNRHFILTLLIEYDFERASVVIDLKAGTHCLFNLVCNSTHYDDIINGFSFNLTDIIRSR